jgi:ribosomal protein S18 acetylase RimI-like enzyme
MSLGVLAPYRGQRIGSTLLDHVVDNVKDDHELAVFAIALHVQTTNSNALHFYLSRGFEVVETIKNYYRNLDCNDAYYLNKRL